MGKGPEQTLLPRIYTNGQQIREKELNFTSYQGNENQNYNEIPPHPCQNGLSTRQVITTAGEVVGKKEASFTAVGKVNQYRYYGKFYGGSSKK